jgi:hypothetical protein
MSLSPGEYSLVEIAVEAARKEGHAEGYAQAAKEIAAWVRDCWRELHCISETDAENIAADIERGEHVPRGEKK